MATLFTINCINVLIKFSLVIFVIYAITLMYVYNTGVLERTPLKEPNPLRKKTKYILQSPLKEPNPFRKKSIYILQWSGENVAPFPFMGKGNSAFIKNKCKYRNCYVTSKVSFSNLKLTEFDAIAFNGRNIVSTKSSQLPKKRSPKQKYIFAATESADRFPVCNKAFDNFFNWTWTYKLSSNFRFGYITIYDLDGNVVGPAIDMKWPNMKPVDENLKEKLSNKTRAAAWFVSHCKTISNREDFVAQVDKHLKTFGWNVDIYGSCGKLKCPKSKWPECYQKLQEEYFFYFSFENSYDVDYVTEKLLTALDNFVVPVVYGTANYSRFLPPGSYLNAKELGPKDLARVMNELINDKEKYYDFFKWRNYFTYKQTLANADICKLCEVLNDEEMVNTVTVWKDFRKWWNTPRHARKCS